MIARSVLPYSLSCVGFINSKLNNLASSLRVLKVPGLNPVTIFGSLHNFIISVIRNLHTVALCLHSLAIPPQGDKDEKNRVCCGNDRHVPSITSADPELRTDRFIIPVFLGILPY